MVPHEDTAPGRTRTGSGRHRGGRPGPEHPGGSRPGTSGARGRHGLRRRRGAPLRLPAIRVSGAAVAMSTVVGISVATTWIISVQGGLPPSVRISDVNSAPSTPGDGDPDEDAPGTGTPPALAGRGSPQQSAASRDVTSARPPRLPLPSARATSSTGSGLDATRPTPTASGSGASPSASGASAGSGVSATPPATGAATASGAPGATAPATGGSEAGSAGPASEPPQLELTPSGDEGLHGVASADTANPYASQDSLDLTVDETLTAVEVEVRVERSGGVRNCGAWTSMPGVVLGVEQDGDALVYRFTLRHGETVPPGHYSFAVQYSHGEGAHDAGGDTWLASAFGVDHPRAVAVRGRFA